MLKIRRYSTVELLYEYTLELHENHAALFQKKDYPFEFVNVERSSKVINLMAKPRLALY
jgi:hypothetical protein